MSTKTHTTAIVAIPPQDVWEPIQAIRRKHDKQARRWMPHITLVYPFRPAENFDALAAPLADALASFESFDVTLSQFRWFSHGPKSSTVWLTPEPRALIKAIHEALWKIVPDCDDVRHYRGGFQPHLSVGQTKGNKATHRLMDDLDRNWHPITFRLEKISLIRRDESTNDVFVVGREIPLGR